MIYSDFDIREAIASGHIIIDPISDDQIQPASIDLRLGSHFKVLEFSKNVSLNSKDPHKDFNKDSFIIFPRSVVLATTIEKIKLPLDICAKVEGRSSIGRKGLIIHTAGFIDPGFEGQITLELVNVGPSPIMLKSGRRICQIVFDELKTPATVGYSGKYQHQIGATASRVYLDKEAQLEEQHRKYVRVRLADENVNDIQSDPIAESEEVTD